MKVTLKVLFRDLAMMWSLDVWKSLEMRQERLRDSPGKSDELQFQCPPQMGKGVEREEQSEQSFSILVLPTDARASPQNTW